MKYMYILLAVILSTCCCKSGPDVELLSVISTEVERILEEVKKEYEKEYNFQNQVFVLRTEKIEDKLEVIISVYDISDFKHCFDDTLFPIYGLYGYKDKQVLVYGHDSNALFQKQGRYTQLDILNCVEQKAEEIKSNIPYPPVTFEPIVWIYTGSSDKLSFKEQAQFNLIE